MLPPLRPPPLEEPPFLEDEAREEMLEDDARLGEEDCTEEEPHDDMNMTRNRPEMPIPEAPYGSRTKGEGMGK